jgi:hypothetical protein
MITFEQFKVAVGTDPIQDDLERSNCDKAGHPGHSCCGWCITHNKPRYMCGCREMVKRWAIVEYWGQKIRRKSIQGKPQLTKEKVIEEYLKDALMSRKEFEEELKAGEKQINIRLEEVEISLEEAMLNEVPSHLLFT